MFLLFLPSLPPLTFPSCPALPLPKFSSSWLTLFPSFFLYYQALSVFFWFIAFLLKRARAVLYSVCSSSSTYSSCSSLWCSFSILNSPPPRQLSFIILIFLLLFARLLQIPNLSPYLFCSSDSLFFLQNSFSSSNVLLFFILLSFTSSALSIACKLDQVVPDQIMPGLGCHDPEILLTLISY